LALNDILKALEDKAEARIDAIAAEAEQRVVEILSEVEKEAARTRRMRIKKVEDQIKSEATGIIYSAQLKAKNVLIKAQEETVDEAFKAAEERLSKLNEQQDYAQVLEVLLDQCLEFFVESEVLVEARADDREHVERMLSARKIKYRISDTPLVTAGGVAVSSANGQIIVSNTFESRLEKARDHLRLEISKTLFGAEE
jgi:V/A-type H+-transporting ATPase subunit E